MGALLGKFRARMGYKSSNKKKPSKVAIRLTRKGISVDEEVDVDRYPRLLTLPTFPPATMVDPNGKMQPAGTVASGLHIQRDREDIRAFLTERGAEAVNIRTKVNPLSFARMLAKIAHGLTIAEVGVDRFVPLNVGLILGRQDNANYTVGAGWLPEIEPAQTQYSFAKWKFGDLLVVQIRLFSYLNAPTYHVAVGAVVDGKDDIWRNSFADKATDTLERQTKAQLWRGQPPLELKAFLEKHGLNRN